MIALYFGLLSVIAFSKTKLIYTHQILGGPFIGLTTIGQPKVAAATPLTPPMRCKTWKESRFGHVRFPTRGVGHVLTLWPGPDARKQVGKPRELEGNGEFNFFSILPRLLTCHNSYPFLTTKATAATQTMRTKKPIVKPTIKPVFDDGLAVKPREKWKLVLKSPK